MSPELITAVPLCRNLPSPPGVALRIIALAQDPDADLATAATLIALDPALSARVLRLSNSALFANRRRSENLQQAINKLGLHPTLQLALGFSLMTNLRGGSAPHAEHERIWRRSLIAAVACRALGDALGVKKPDDWLLAGLIQDIGALYLMQHHPAQYQPIIQAAAGDNAQLLALEQAQLGADHARIGAELAHHWDLPEHLVQAIALSETAPGDSLHSLHRCVYGAGQLADIWLDTQADHDQARQLELLGQRIALPAPALETTLARIKELLPDMASAFDATLCTPQHIEALLEQAREVTQLRQLVAHQEAETLRERADTLERHAIELSTMAHRDALTGTINRGHFEHSLAAAFDLANLQQRPLSLAFIDLDDFKKINDRHGHLVGDDVLKGVAQHLKACVRTVDTVARFGGEEFVIIFPDTPLTGAQATIERVLQHLAQQPVAHVEGTPLHVTFSAGIACHHALAPFSTPHTLLDAADRALYRCKDQGRNRVGIHQS